MINRIRQALPHLSTVLVILVLIGFGVRTLWAARPSRQVELVVWGLASGEETKGLDAQIVEFQRRYPHIRVKNLAMGAGGMSSQKLLTSIVGGAPPDLVRQDRFTIGDWASRETFLSMDDLLANPRLNGPGDPWRIVPSEYYEPCWAEALYQGKVYAIPDSTDDRVLYWNKDLFRAAGLDPEKPPRTWEEMDVIADKLTKRRPDGQFEQIGFIPVVPSYSNSFFYLYSWQAGGEFMSPDGRTCTLHNPESQEALEWLAAFYKRMSGAESVIAFSNSFQPNEQDPFITGRMAMKIDTNNAVRNLGRFGPKLDFGVAPAPVPEARLRGEGRFKGQPPFITWSGGYSYAIPVGSKHVEEAWLFIKWMNSLESRRIFDRTQKEWNESQTPPRPYVPELHANREINKVLFAEFAPQGDDPLSRRMREGMRVGLELMPVARFRPVTFVGQRLWDEHVRAFDSATRRQASPADALRTGQQIVQEELDLVYTRS
ncbi:MAG TPA: ABC transporter substrate-binding protein, partial [Armatimonadota bacterium]|nr:ABC transporter substrate-binding protein [Armatimonadota bacterium]